VSPSARKRHALALFAGLGPDYDRMGALLSFGQDPRWRRALVARVRAGPGDRVLDVATGTGLVAQELVRSHGCSVVGLDQSEAMLAVARANLPASVELIRGEAERLPFAEAELDALTFTYPHPQLTITRGSGRGRPGRPGSRLRSPWRRRVGAGRAVVRGSAWAVR
jgi:demethylmenaquinone methyltransferase / 2-methoxy-6-polyprenyl-1,4-benzoquinol methylase